MVGRKSDEYVKLIIHVRVGSRAAEASSAVCEGETSTSTFSPFLLTGHLPQVKLSGTSPECLPREAGGSSNAITLLSERQRNVWPIRNAGEPGTSFIWACRNVCWVNFLHQSLAMGGFPSLAVCVSTRSERPSPMSRQR